MTRSIALFLVWALTLARPIPAAEPVSLQSLRDDVALRWFDVEPHLRLAKYHRDHGNPLLGFYISEYTRRVLSEGAAFDAAHRRVFVDRAPFDNSAEGEARVAAQLAEDPESVDLLMKLADIHISRSSWEEATRYLKRAIALQPDGFTPRAVLAEVYRRDGREAEGEALVKAFLDEHPESLEAVMERIASVFDDDPKRARELVEEAIAAYPEDGSLHFKLAILMQRADDDEAAERSFRRAAELAADSATIQGWVGRFILKVKDDGDGALPYYLAAYFLDPHFYDTEFAEGRIRSINAEAAARVVAQQADLGVAALMAHDNPIVVSQAMEAMQGEWTPEHTVLLMAAMTHDYPGIRSSAMLVLRDHPELTTIDQIEELLGSSDLRQRGLAAYLLAARRGEDAVHRLASWLDDPAQLLRFDALSALVVHCGDAGRKRAIQHRASEPNPSLKALLESLQEAEPTEGANGTEADVTP